MKTLLTVMLLVMLSGCGDKDYYIPGAHKEELMKTLKITDLSDQKSVVSTVREYIYMNNVSPSGWPLRPPFGAVSPIDTRGDFYWQFLEWKAGSKKYQCGELGYVQAWMLEELGIPARGVALATVDYFSGGIYTTHVTTEAYLGGRWVISDATFNVTLQCNGGENTNVLGLRECLSAGGTVTWLSGPAYRAPLSLEEYFTPFANLLYAYETNFAYSSRLRKEPVRSHPYVGWIR